MTGAARWSHALRALAALAVDPSGLRGISVRASAGPVRQGFEDAVTTLLDGPFARIAPGASDTALTASIDITRSLAERRLVHRAGYAERAAVLILPMAERIAPGMAAGLARHLDRSDGPAAVLLDEGVGEDERTAASLADRLAFHVSLDGIPYQDAILPASLPDDIRAAKHRLQNIVPTDDHAATLTTLAARLGIDSLRAPLLALRATRAFAALDGATGIGPAHLQDAAELVLAPRATILPEPEETAEDRSDPDTPTPDECHGGGTLPDEIDVAAIAAFLPADLLNARLAERGPRRAFGGSGAGHRRTGNRKGRPLPSRPGRPDGRARVDIVATLRTAAPFQTLRRRAASERTGIIVLPSDIRLRRYEDHSDRLLVFAVDASGSSALARMAEAKGAVELLLARAYARRDHVALVAFRGSGAETLMPATRSLVRAKRSLAELPGGGGTPLAAGLQAAATLAEAGSGRGYAATLIVLTDGRANVALDGAPGRDPAQADSERVARAIRLRGHSAVVIDTARRPGADGATLAAWLGARHIALPRADANRISAALDDARSG
ncbi:magnesium chelatase subunit D [Sulfitobacter sp. D35]|uniref:magnesium chelatase subunit D n=1 Tax=Sulfitobacter sp. D35 TaxID=3083252 RepID=UPI00296FBACC|nr:magnesium chelatase subunit D [Sulfitobacter sp. D35]MDW4499430.1 magnesium chelatase subunit D [Sulfitobacter sp. D35]